MCLMIYVMLSIFFLKSLQHGITKISPLNVFTTFWIKLLRLWQAIARLWITLFLQEFSTLTGVDTLRNMLVIFRKTSFPFNITLNLIPTLHWNQAQFFIKYLCITNFTQQFFSWILKILIADRRKAQTDRINNDSNIV